MDLLFCLSECQLESIQPFFPIGIDATHGLMRRYVVTPANIHDSQVLAAPLGGENGEAMVWADSAYQLSKQAGGQYDKGGRL